MSAFFVSRYFFSVQFNELMVFFNWGKSVESIFTIYNPFTARWWSTLSPLRKSAKKSEVFLTNGLVPFRLSAGVNDSKKSFTKSLGLLRVSSSVDREYPMPSLKKVLFQIIR